MADHQNEVTVCGIEMPSEGDETYELCSNGGNIISITLKIILLITPECTSNQVDVCGTVMVLGQIVEKLASLPLQAFVLKDDWMGT